MRNAVAAVPMGIVMHRAACSASPSTTQSPRTANRINSTLSTPAIAADTTAQLLLALQALLRANPLHRPISCKIL